MVAEIVELESEQIAEAIKRCNSFAELLLEQGFHPLVVGWALSHTSGQVDYKVLDDVCEIVYPDEE